MDAATRDPRERLIVALDVADRAAARALVRSLGGTVGFYKVGHQLFGAAGPDAVRELVGEGKRVLLDLKLHETPTVTAAAVHAAADLGVSMLTLHALGGRAMLAAAVQAARAESGLELLAITVPTSLTVEDLRELGIRAGLGTHALRLALLARGSGCAGVVCAPGQAAVLREALGAGCPIVVPTRQPGEALRAGASHAIVGRPVTHAPDPRRAVLALLEEIGAATN